MPADFSSFLHAIHSYSLIHLNDVWHPYAGKGGWNDPDILEVGNGDLTLGENRAHFTLWCLAKAPLLLGNDLTNMPKDIFDIITNTEVIAWNQDPLGVQGYMRWSSATAINGEDTDEYEATNAYTATEIWAGSLDGGDIAVVLLNRSPETKTITAQFQDIGISGPGPVHVRDVWAHEDWEEVQHQSLTATVPSHDVVALRLTPDASSMIRQLRGGEHYAHVYESGDGTRRKRSSFQ